MLTHNKFHDPRGILVHIRLHRMLIIQIIGVNSFYTKTIRLPTDLPQQLKQIDFIPNSQVYHVQTIVTLRATNGFPSNMGLTTLLRVTCPQEGTTHSFNFLNHSFRKRQHLHPVVHDSKHNALQKLNLTGVAEKSGAPMGHSTTIFSFLLS